MNKDTVKPCARCFALVRAEDVEMHRRWHGEAEQIEMPSSLHGYWGGEGKWIPAERANRHTH